MTFKTMLLCCSVLSAAGPAFSAENEITIQVWGSTWQNLLQPMSQRFEAETGIKVNVITQSSSGEGLLKLQAERENSGVDVWFTTNAVAATAAEDDKLFTKIPKDKLTNAANLIDGGSTEDWVGIYYYPMGIIYDVDNVPAVPTSWEDLWKPEFADQIVAPSMSIYSGSLMLVGNELNGGTTANFDPGFEALSKLNPNISLYYTSDSQARQSVAQGEGSILIGQPAHLSALKKEGINVKMISPKPAPMYFDVMMMVNGERQEESAKFIDFVISEQEQATMTTTVNMAPVNRLVSSTEELREALPAEGAGIVFDGKMISANVADWSARFEKLVAN